MGNNRGLERRYDVRPVGREAKLNEQFFVLSSYDKFSKFCLTTYANFCEDEYPELAKDLRELAKQCV